MVNTYLGMRTYLSYFRLARTKHQQILSNLYKLTLRVPVGLPGQKWYQCSRAVLGIRTASKKCLKIIVGPWDLPQIIFKIFTKLSQKMRCSRFIVYIIFFLEDERIRG